jgi:hypothetical protein
MLAESYHEETALPPCESAADYSLWVGEVKWKAPPGHGKLPSAKTRLVLRTVKTDGGVSLPARTSRCTHERCGWGPARGTGGPSAIAWPTRAAGVPARP